MHLFVENGIRAGISLVCRRQENYHKKAIVKSCTLTPITCTATQCPDLAEGLKRHKKLPTEDHFLNNDHNILGDPGAVCWVGKNRCENFKEQEKEPLGCYS